MTTLKPQEIYLLERFTSVEYFSKLCQAWREMVLHVEQCLKEFIKDVPADYRSRPLPEQPDAVWGERVIPNFRDTLQGLDDALVRLSHGDLTALEYAHGPFNDSKGQSDFWSGWMSIEDEKKYEALMDNALLFARNIVATIIRTWYPEALSVKYDESSRGPLLPPLNWPVYTIEKNLTVRSGDEVNYPGIYLPDIDNSCAEFLYSLSGPAPNAIIQTGIEDLIIPGTQKKYGEKPIHEKRECVWFLVRRTSDDGARSVIPTLTSQINHRVGAGSICPQTGYYITPADINRRQKFQQGETMPAFESNFGLVIWQWDVNQDF